MLSHVPLIFRRQPENSWCTKRYHLVEVALLPPSQFVFRLVDWPTDVSSAREEGIFCLASISMFKETKRCAVVPPRDSRDELSNVSHPRFHITTCAFLL